MDQMEKNWFIVRGGDNAQEGPFDIRKIRKMAANGQIKRSDRLRNKNDGYSIKAGDFWGFLTGANSSAAAPPNAQRADTSKPDYIVFDASDELCLEDEFCLEAVSLEPSKHAYAEPKNRADRQSDQHAELAIDPVGKFAAKVGECLGGLLILYLLYLGYRWLYSPVVTAPQRSQSSIIAASSKEPSIPIPIASDPTQQLTKLGGKIEQWKGKRDKLAEILSTLEVDKNKTASSLRKLGANAEDIKSNDPKAATLLVELQDILRQIVNFDKKRNEYDLAIFKSESRLRTMERRLAALDLVGTDEELSALISSIAEIDQELDSETSDDIPIELDELLINSLNDSKSSESGSVQQKP